ncbi:hypothetical protein P5673_011497 [Acropora cervicornis]|uniref:Uncharacterized protein n=1 Tax=Acropora cervicornis TaxID=6130 RepID=A0AAD9QNW9_ACRCE|nr:hypothetical protein P5673_011497 [Acropora cervicornis]
MADNNAIQKRRERCTSNSQQQVEGRNLECNDGLHTDLATGREVAAIAVKMFKVVPCIKANVDLVDSCSSHLTCQ